jgi:hypothetical protein
VKYHHLVFSGAELAEEAKEKLEQSGFGNVGWENVDIMRHDDGEMRWLLISTEEVLTDRECRLISALVKPDNTDFNREWS